MKDDPKAFLLRSRLMLWATTLIAAGITAILLVSFGVAALMYRDLSIEFLKRLGASWLPGAFYLWALWSLRGMFAVLYRGGMTFQAAVTRTLGQVGWALTAGAAAGVILTPYATTGGVRLVGAFAVLFVPSLALGVVGLSLVAVARLLGRAARLEAQNISLQSTLDEFI